MVHFEKVKKPYYLIIIVYLEPSKDIIYGIFNS